MAINASVDFDFFFNEFSHKLMSKIQPVVRIR